MPVDVFSVESPEIVLVEVSIAKDRLAGIPAGRAQQLWDSVLFSYIH